MQLGELARAPERIELLELRRQLAPAFGAQQKFMYIADGANGRVYVLNRADGAQLSSFGRTGRMAGEFKWVHNIAIDRQGNLYTSEVGFGRRVQKFNLVSF